MGPDFWRELPEVFTALDRDEDVRAVVMDGAGKVLAEGATARNPELAATLREMEAQGYKPFIAAERE